MTKLPDDVRFSLELAGFLEREIEPYEGEELERAQNAIRAVLKSGLIADGSAGIAALPTYYRDCIHAAVERRPPPALPPGLIRPGLQSFPILAFLHPTAGLARTPWEWVSMFEQEVAAAISAALLAEGDQSDPQAGERLTALAMSEGQALYREGWRAGAFQYRSPAEIHDWFWPRLVERLRSTEYPPPPPPRREVGRCPLSCCAV